MSADGSHRSPRTIMTERDLAELEVRLELEECFDRAGLEERLKHALQHSPSLPIAAPNGEVEWPHYDTGSLSRQTPLARSHPATGEADAPRFQRQATRREVPPDKRLEQLLIALRSQQT